MRETLAVERTAARMSLYRFLSRCYTYPDRPFVEAMEGEEGWEAVRAAVAAAVPEAQEAVSEMEAFVRGYGSDTERLLTDLQVEYTYLFINAVPSVPAPPYESAYTDRGLLMGRPVSEVVQAYREAGLVVRSDYDGLPDHIAAELEFVAYLMEQELEAADSSAGETAQAWRSRRRAFLEAHLLRWAPPFLEKVARSARRPFYRHVAQLTGALLASERERSDPGG